ncbi:hypothetical protein ACX27_17935 [Nostoc piscinale CENA21]|uniref:Uncharacterized protein n=1 Tax=Nostoc piscinale CENA21 TaxID=224013 RepID=A0A0M5MH91_9NOSO|nr:hypothetical protein [Nostoc piscinale]ALF54300.1 hypothetical protein ACX27_17935 [Nostoc piscinale CENA21]
MSDQNSLSLGVLGRWMLLTVIGFIVGGVVGTGVGFVAIPVVGMLLAFLPLPGAQGQGAIGYLLYGSAIAAAVVAGVIIGISQWFILQRWFTRRLWWILASAFGWAGIAFTMSVLTYTHVAGPVGQPDGTFLQTTLWDNRGAIASSITGVLIAALVIGILQSLALRFTLLQAALWTVMNIVVFLIAAVIIILWVRGAGGIFGVPVFFCSLFTSLCSH